MSAVQPLISIINNSSLDISENIEDAPGAEIRNANSDVAGTTGSMPVKKAFTKIIVATTDVAELSRYLSDYDYDGIIGSQQSTRKGVAFPVLSVPQGAIEGIASLPSVLGVYDYVDPVSAIITDGTTFSRNMLGMLPNSATVNALNIEAGTMYHGAEDAWANGYTGEGVKIATVTSGTDFGNAELIGRQAIIEDSASPYYNYPIAFDPASMSMFVSEGLQESTLPPSDSWYVNTSSSDLRILHTVVIDGVNDFWTELNPYNLSHTVYNLTMTSDKKAQDPAEDMSNLELDLKSLFVSSDKDNWYMGFEVTPETDTWTRSFDVRYGLYIDADGIAGSGAKTDPLGNLITAASAFRPEFAIYFNHVGIDWGVNAEGVVWSKNNTVQNATFHAWVSGSWRSLTLIGDLPYNVTKGINPGVGSMFVTTVNGTYVRHNNEDYKLAANNTIFYEGGNVKIETIISTQAFGGDFVELQMPKKVIPGVNSFSSILFSSGINVSHAQDTVPSDPSVAFESATWDSDTTVLLEFTTINEPPQYVTTGIPSKSGVYRIGLHPDQNLMNLHYGRPVAVLLTDYYVSGVYDAVFVDLDNDKSFADEIPMMRYGAYNESLMIGPRWGTQRFANNSVRHNNTWYQMKNYTISTEWSNETLTDSATGGETIFYLGNTSVDPASLVVNRPTQHDNAFSNESVVYTIDDTEMTPWSFFLPHGNIINDTFIICHYFNGADHYYESLLDMDPTVDINTVTGEVTFTDGSIWDAFLTTNGLVSADFYAWYEYTVPVNQGYAFDAATSKLTLTEALQPGDCLDVMYSYKKTVEEDITPAHRYGTIIYKGNPVELELRDWVSNKDIDAEGGAGDGMIYPDLSGGMAYFIARETHVTGEVLAVSNKTSSFANKYVVEDSVTIYKNGIAISEKNATINYLDGKVELLIDIAGTDVITADYAYRIPIPYSDMYWEWNSIENEDRKIPGNGDMIAFFGEFEEGSTRGTEVGAAICAGGVMTDAHKEENELQPNALVKGMAPDAKLISIRGGAFASWYFAVEGYDGIVGTGDDAQIVAITSNFPVSNTGWDVYTKGAEYIGKYYAKGNVTFVAATGDNGFGYGTAMSPGSSEATITAAQGTLFDYRCYNPGAPTELARVYADSGQNPHHGDVLPSAGRGPNMLGNPEPDVVTAGAFLFGSIPLNVDQDYTTMELDWFGGQWAWDLWSGSAASAASTAGILALIYGAYHQATGMYPNNTVAKSLLKSGADNMNYDILTQGAGWSNADRSTQLAAGLDGIYLDKTYWVPGDYRGVRYEGFVKLMEPGESASQTVTVTNKNPAQPTQIQVYDAIFHKFGEHTISMNIGTMYDDLDTPGVINIEPYIAVGTELLKVTATSPRKPTMQTYMAELFDWTDANENGIVDFPSEQNRMTYVIGSNSLEVRYRDPIGRVTDGLAVQVKGFGGSGEPLENWTIHMEFYEKVDWSWLTLANAPANLAAGVSAAFTMNLNVPTYAGVGSYEGAVYINEKVPEEDIATGVGHMEYNVTFRNWAYVPGGGTEAVINDDNLTSGNRMIVPMSSIINWNGSYLYEGVDYTISSYVVTFVKEYPVGGVPIPTYAEYFNMTYLTILAQGGNPLEEATWTGQLGTPNVVKGSYILRKDGVVWDETETIVNEKVVNATGGETMAGLYYRNVVRETATLYLNGTVWPRDGGEVTESITPVNGQDNITLSHGNIVPGSVVLTLNSNDVPQTAEVTIFNKELVQGLNSTTMPGSVTFEQIGADTAGSVWDESGTWYAKLPINADDTPTRSIFTSMLYANGVPLIPGPDFVMHADGVHGMIKFTGTLDPATITYSAQYTYYDNNLDVGHLSHGQIIAESYTLYLNGASMKSTEYFLDLETGEVTLMNPLGPNQIVEAAYKYNVYLVDLRNGLITLSDLLTAVDEVDVSYRYFTYTLDMATGVLQFADPLSPGNLITADYTYARYTLDMMKGTVKFASALLPDEVVSCEYYYYSNVIPVFFNIGADRPDFSFGGSDTTMYTFNITAGTDIAGNALVAGQEPNPWTFTVGSLDAPTITNTVPANGNTSVALASPVVVTFSEPMNTGSVTYACTPAVAGWSVVWSVGDTVATYSHTGAFVENTVYTFQITAGIDVAGNALIVDTMPNPWHFTTLATPVPTITTTVPANGAANVALAIPVVVTFSHPMNIGTVTYTCDPDPTGWSVVWTAGDTVATYSHTIAFDENSVYTFQITAGTDAVGNNLVPGAVPNPWTFITVGAPTIMVTTPTNAAHSVALTADVVVTFSEAMNTTSVAFSSTPDPTGWSVVWTAGDTIATYSHTTAFDENTVYTFQITAGTDVAGNDLVPGAVPNPWAFITLGAPIITNTVPANGAMNVALASTVVVTFSEAMNTGSVTYTCTPDPTGWSVVWSAGNTAATYTYAGGLLERTIYTFQITGGTDVAGNNLVAGSIPNPWSFSTIGAPIIKNTVPVNGATGVALASTVVATFSEAMNTASVTYTCVPAVTGWSVVWSGGNTIATYSHMTPYLENTLYTFTITAGTDIAGNALVPGAVPNPWLFTTLGVQPVIISTTPVNEATGVASTAPIVVIFSEPMNTASVTFTCTPDPTGWSVVWSAGNTVATFSHSILFTESVSDMVAKYAYDDLFRYNEIRGGYGSEGDWRFVYFDVKEQGRYAFPTDNERLLVDVEWEYDMSDVDVQVFGGRESLPGIYSGWPYDSLPSERYGPHTVRHIGGSDVTSDFFTTTGGPEEITAPRISPGLNVIGLHTVGMNGSAKCTETFSAKVGTMYIDQTEVNIVTNQYVGETTINMHSNMVWSGVGGIAAGPSAPESLKNQSVAQDEDDWSLFDTFEEQLASGKTVYSRTIQDCLIFNVHIWGGTGVVDMDLGVFLDGSGEGEKKDGVVQADEFVAMCADWDADEEVKLIAPKDGTYLIVPFGFTLSMDPALFDMDITIVQGTGFDVQGKGTNSLPADQKGYFSSNQTEYAYNQTYLTLKWDLPGSASGTLQGALYVGPGNGPMCMLVPIVLTIDTTPPVISDMLPNPLAFVNNRRPDIVVTVNDFDRGELVPSSMKLYLDGNDITTQASISIPFDDSDNVAVKGYSVGTAMYTPRTSLSDGAHVVTALIIDKAGNEAILDWVFTVDSATPYFALTYPSESVSYTRDEIIEVTGYTENGIIPRMVGANAIDFSMGTDGSFRMTLPLDVGANIFTLRVADLAGNTNDIIRTVVRDSTVPGFTSVRFSTGFTTNNPYTTMSGKLTKTGTLAVNGAPITVNSDGSFEKILGLSEGLNTFHLEFMDLAGNTAHSWQNVTLDTFAPVILLTSTDTKVTNQSFVLTGSVEANSELLVNGKRVNLGTRQSSGTFSTILTLSEGQNIIVIEAKDGAGNVVEVRHVVEYEPVVSSSLGTLCLGIIAVMIFLVLVFYKLVFRIAKSVFGGKKDETPDEGYPDDSELPPPDDVEPMDGDQALVDLEAPPEEGEPPAPEDDLLVKEEIGDVPEAEPIPAEESLPEEMPPEVPPVEPESEELPKEEEIETISETEAVSEPEAVPEPEAVTEEPEDPRIAKLKSAYESGKISKELYEKNLAKFKGQ
ncbi:MAG: Ig-like domain-containing protein [Candidatus Thermoplasmatota archaeon]|nr:Ig-like domain-containing protein [Candidatus Thermoplasmatota archaeon]